jgi:hypothetical protein
VQAAEFVVQWDVLDSTSLPDEIEGSYLLVESLKWYVLGPV